MGKAVLFLIALFAAAFFANYFQIVSIPWLDVAEVSTYSGDAQNTGSHLKKMDD